MADQVRALRRLKRHRRLGGVCGGIAKYIDWPVSKVRFLYVLISVLTAVFPGTLLYIVLWILMPEDEYDTQNVTIEKQVQLPWKQSLQMASNGIRIEFHRSLLTSLSIICALAFFSFLRADADCLAALRSAADQDAALGRKLMVAGQMADEESQVERKLLLVLMSLIVCTVGISNAMAMSVTERFQQIGTMKCLGALNTFVARLFILEAMFLGFAGTVIGDAAGMFLAITRQMSTYGLAVLKYFPWTALAVTAGYTILVGVGISLLGAFYPAVVAARMEPVEAMRVTT